MKRSAVACGLLMFGGGALGIFLTVLMLVFLGDGQEMPPFRYPSTISELRACEGEPVQLRVRLLTDEVLELPVFGVQENALCLTSWGAPYRKIRDLGLAASMQAGQLRCVAAEGDNPDSMPVELRHEEIPGVRSIPLEKMQIPERIRPMLREHPYKMSYVLAERYRDPAVVTDWNLCTGDTELNVRYSPSGTLFYIRGKVEDGVLLVERDNGWAGVYEHEASFPPRKSGRGRAHARGLAYFGAVAAPLLLAAGVLMLRMWEAFGLHRRPFWRTLVQLIVLIAGASLAFQLALWQEFCFHPFVQWGLAIVGLAAAVWSAFLIRNSRETN